ncbi:MAG: enolase C-terminal domain-like protein, partial [Pseudomonadota bacterium]
PDQRIATAREWAAGGLTGIKLFFDGDTRRGVEELAALRAAVPDIERWMVDVLWSLADVEAAAEARRAYGELDVVWLECPLIPEDLDGHRQLQEYPGTPVALGEHFHTHYESRSWLAGMALNVFQPDVGRTGISDMLRQIEIGRAAGILTTPHMGSGLDIFQAATLHMAAVCEPDLLCEYQAGLSGRLEGAIDTGWVYRDGSFVLPDRPGLGVDITLDHLERFIVRAA